MQTTTPGLPMASRHLYSCASVDAAAVHLARFLGGHHRVEPLVRQRPVDFVHHHAALAGIGVNALQYGTPLEIHAETEPDDYLLLVFLAGHGEFRQDGRWQPLGVAHTAVINPGRRVHLRLSADQRNLTLRIPGPLLRETAARLLGRRNGGAIEFAAPAPAQALRRHLGSICADLDDPAGPAAPTAAGTGIGATLRSLLLEFVLAEVPNSHSEALHAPAAPDAGSRHLFRAREFIHANLRGPLTLADIAAAAGTSARTLQAGFQRAHGCSPLQYVRARRLELAHADLERDAAPGRSVTGIAIDCGFTHMAKFARAYRERYGETPSATRARRLRGDLPGSGGSPRG